MESGAPDEQDYASYLVRVWRPEVSLSMPAGKVWHSEVEHFQSGEHWYFRSVEELAQFLSDRIRNL